MLYFGMPMIFAEVWSVRLELRRSDKPIVRFSYMCIIWRIKLSEIGPYSLRVQKRNIYMYLLRKITFQVHTFKKLTSWWNRESTSETEMDDHIGQSPQCGKCLPVYPPSMTFRLFNSMSYERPQHREIDLILLTCSFAEFCLRIPCKKSYKVKCSL